jgi:hypothetical protein
MKGLQFFVGRHLRRKKPQRTILIAPDHIIDMRDRRNAQGKDVLHMIPDHVLLLARHISPPTLSQSFCRFYGTVLLQDFRGDGPFVHPQGKNKIAPYNKGRSPEIRGKGAVKGCPSNRLVRNIPLCFHDDMPFQAASHGFKDRPFELPFNPVTGQGHAGRQEPHGILLKPSFDGLRGRCTPRVRGWLQIRWLEGRKHRGDIVMCQGQNQQTITISIFQNPTPLSGK